MGVGYHLTDEQVASFLQSDGVGAARPEGLLVTVSCRGHIFLGTAVILLLHSNPRDPEIFVGYSPGTT